MAHGNIYGEWDPITGNIPIAHPAGKVTYNSVWGLYINDHHYDGHVATYIPRTALTKTGRVAKKQPPKPQKQPWTYWKAQCAYRGLSPKGSIVQLQERLQGYETAPVIEEFRAIEEQAKQKCLARSSQVVQSARASQASQEADDMWAQDMSDEEKASTDLRRYLVETFLADGATPEAVVIQGDNSSGQRWALGVQKVARDLGLMTRIVEVTPDPDESEVDDRRWVVVGAKKSTMAEAAHTIMETTEDDQEDQSELQSDRSLDEEREAEALRQ
ncbi:cytochrome P450 [Apiospora arundinis]